MKNVINIEGCKALAEKMAKIGEIEIKEPVINEYVVTIAFSNTHNEDGTNLTTDVVVYAESEDEAIFDALYEKRGLKHLGLQFNERTCKVRLVA